MIDSGKEEGRLIQDPYSIRCAPHVIGAARDGLTWVLDVLHRELNSVNDNPIVDPERGETVFAGNCYGRPPVGSRFAGFDPGDRRGPGLHRRTRAATMIGTRMHRLRTAGTRRG